MRKVLVTGADGFIGSHLTELLISQDIQVRALSYYNSFNHWGWLEDIEKHPNLEVVSGDIRDPYLCQKICKGVDAVFHLAALIGIPYSYLAPNSYVDVNVKGTLNICEAARSEQVKKVLITSTSEVYGTAKYVPMDERHPLQPQSPYSASKISADAMAMSYYHSFDLPVVLVRPFNTYGPRQSARAVIPTMIGQIVSGKTEIRLGDVSPTRDFTYVKDMCRGFLELARCEKAVGKAVNIGSGSEISIQTALETIGDILGKKFKFVVDESRLRPKDSEVHRLWCDNSLIKSLTGFTSQYDLRSGLAETIQWFKNPENLRKYKNEIYTI